MFLNKLAIKMIKAYQKKDRPHRCRHIPSCSNYGLECYQKFNFIKASFLTSYRIIRCNPLSYKIFDPVPLTKKEKKEKLHYQMEAKKIDNIIRTYSINDLIIYIWEDTFGMVDSIYIDNYSSDNVMLFFAKLERISILSKKKKTIFKYKDIKDYLKSYIFSDITKHPNYFINNN